MGTDTSAHSTTNISAERPVSTDPNATVSEEEGNAIQYVKGLKEFYSHAGMFAIFAIVVVVFKRTDDPAVLWAFAGWGVGVVLHGLVAFNRRADTARHPRSAARGRSRRWRPRGAIPGQPPCDSAACAGVAKGWAGAPARRRTTSLVLVMSASAGGG